MSQKFVTNGGISIPNSQELELAGHSIGEISNDNTLSNPSSAALPTELAVKTYVDNQLGSTDMTFAADSNSAGLSGDDLKVDLSGGETFSILGTTGEIETDTAVANQIKIGLPNDVTIGQHLTVTGDLSAGAEKLYIDGTQVVSTGAELNIVDGDTAATDTTVESGDRVVYNDEGTMVQVDVDKIDTYFSATTKTLTNKTMTSPDLNTPDIDGGTIDGATIATSDVTVGSSKTLNVSAGTLETSSAQDVAILASAATNNDANLDFGAYEVHAQTFQSDIATGTAPMTIASTTVVTNLNADKVDGCDVVDEDDMTSDSATSVPTQQSVKKYVDDQLGSSALSATIGASTYSLDLDSENISFAGTSAEVDVSAAEDGSGNVTVTYGLPTDVDIAGDLTPATFTMNEFTVDASGNTDIDGTLSVEGVPTFQAKSVHSSGIDCNGTLEMEGNTIEGNATEMLISADGTDTDPSDSTAGSLSINASGGIFTDDAVDMDSTLNVESTATFQAQSVHSSGLQTGGSIVSDADGQDSLGSASGRWANVHSNEFEMTNSAKKDLSVAMTGSALEVVSFADADFDTAKIVVKVSDGTNMTAQEVLVASAGGSCKIVEYAKVSIGTEISMTWAVSSDGTNTSITCNAANSSTLKGSYDLLKA